MYATMMPIFALLLCLLFRTSHLMDVESIAAPPSPTSLFGAIQSDIAKALVPSESLCNPIAGNIGSQCSSNSNCQCLPFPTAEFVGICTAQTVACSSLTPCQDDNMTCSKPYTICLRQHQCENIDRPVCYPLSLIDPDTCPPLSIMENGTTIFTTTTTQATTVLTTTTTEATTTVSTTTTTKATTLTLTTTSPSLDSCNCLSWNPNGTTVARAVPGAIQQLTPFSVAVDSQTNVYVADHVNFRIQKYIPGDSTIVTLVKNGTNLGNLISGLFLDNSGQNIYYCDVNVYRIQKLSLINGTIKTVVGGKGGANTLDSIWNCDHFYVDSNENIFVSDRNYNRVLKFTPGSQYGKLVAGDGSPGSDYYHLHLPNAIYVDEQTSDIYVIDSQNERLQRWKDGDFWTGGETIVKDVLFRSASGLLLDKCGNIFVSNTLNHTILQYPVGNTQKPIFIAGTGQAGGTARQLNSTRGITFDKNFNLYVSDWGNGRVQRFKAQQQQNCTVSVPRRQQGARIGSHKSK